MSQKSGIQFCLMSLVVVILIGGVTCTTNNAHEGQSNFAWASYYGDHMVLQRAPSRANIWGYGDVGGNVTVTVYPDVKGKTYHSAVKTGPEDKGVWSVTLDPMPPGGPHTVKAVQTTPGEGQSIMLEDVLFGDVWLCSGQSNMCFTVKWGQNDSAEIAAAADYPHIRLFTADQVASDTPLYDVKSIMQPWSVASPESINGTSHDPISYPFGYFSAVCWFFGRDLYDQLKVPMGLIVSAWGGTGIQAWSPPEVIKACHDRESDRKRMDNVPRSATHQYVGEDSWKIDVAKPRQHDSALWNAMIHPFLNMTIKGVIWYQGEANAVFNETDVYSCLFPLMISSWRDGFHRGSGGLTDPVFPFGFAQLSVGSQNYPELRWSQTAGYGYTPNPEMPRVFMSVGMDLWAGREPLNVHIRDKQDVGSRLVLGARSLAYGDSSAIFHGPLPVEVILIPTFNIMNVSYNVSGTLEVRNSSGFQICCSSEEKTCRPHSSTWMDAKIVYHNANMVTVSTAMCAKYVTSWRYDWEPVPCHFKQCAVYCKETRLPAPPFKGDIARPVK